MINAEKKRLILRDLRGCLGGYLIEEKNVLRCRLYADCNDATLHLLRRNGTTGQHLLSGRETIILNDAARETAGAYVTRGRDLLLITDEEARRRYHDVKCAESTEMTKHKTEQWAEDKAGVSPERDQKSAEAPERTGRESAWHTSQWPQQRWPPPALIRQPVYRQGYWQEENRAPKPPQE